MKKHIFSAIAFTACLALCAAVWPQTEMVEKTPVPIIVTALSATEPTVEETADEAKITPSAKEEKIELPQLQDEPIHEVIHEPESVPEEVPATPEMQPTPDSAPEPTPTTASTSAPAPSQAVNDSQLGDMVFVPGFGWLETQGPNEVIHDESIYENSNKIGVMG